MSKQEMKVNLMDLQGNLAKGVIQLPIAQARIIASNQIGVVNATDGGHVASDTDPKLIRVNTSTDKAMRLEWVSGSVIEIQFPSVAYPPDLDDTADVIVNILAAMKSGSVDVPVLTVSAWEGVGDTNMGGATAALSTTLTKMTRTLTAANIGAYPNFLTLGLVPAAHATGSNDVYVYAVWIEYTRKV